jgi:tetratricopeptide (TPR) repeat protein
MPGVSSVDIPHTAFTNHRIPRYPIGSGRPAATRAGIDGRDNRRLISFHHELLDADERTEIGRDLGVVLCREGPASARVALPLLEAAVAAHPDDVTAWESKAYALGSLSRYNEAAAAFRKALAQEPGRESALVGAAYLAVQMDRRKDAAAYWQRAIAINPWRSDYHGELALVYFHDRNWKGSADACRQALQLNASWVDVRRWLLYCYLNLGNTEAARGELETILGFDPPDRADLLRAFSAQSQSGGRTP